MDNNKLRSKKTIFILVLSFLLFLIGNNKNVGSIWSKVEQYALEFTYSIDSLFSPISKPRIWFENQSFLRRKLMEAELLLREKDAQILKVQNLEKENQDLRSSIASISGSKKMWMPGHLLFNDNDSYVDLGSRDGVVIGSVITTHGAYIGLVTETREYISLVSTIASEDSRLGVRTSTGVLGVLTVGQRGLIMTCISRTDAVALGDVIQTLGDSSGRSGGILVGYIEKVLTRTADPVSSFLVRPAIDPYQITVVLVQKGNK